MKYTIATIWMLFLLIQFSAAQQVPRDLVLVEAGTRFN